jgi:hypothetical protein
MGTEGRTTGAAFSTGLIQFNSKSARWEFRGVGFKEDLTPGATWDTTSSGYDTHLREWFFTGTARVLDEQHRDARYSVVPIINIPEGSADKLTATVADIGAGGHRRIFDIEMTRISLPADFSGDLSTVATIRSLSKDHVKQVLSAAGWVPA